MSSDLYSFANLWCQYRACRRNKRNTLNALAFEIDAEAKLLDLQRELRAHTYRPGRSVCFVTEGPKPREVFAADYRFKSGPRGVPAPDTPDYPIPAQKSLFGKDNERGLPIGNLTSQFWANVYLNELDQFVKRELKCRFYVRYVDDLVLLHDDPDVLRHWREEIRDFLAARLKLRLREPDVEAQPVGRGIEFVGWKTFWNHRVARRQTLANCASRLRRFERWEMRPMWNGAAWRVDLTGKGAASSRVEQLQASLASYSGHLRHGAAWAAWEQMWQQHPWLHAICRRTGWSIDLRWPARDLRGPRFSRQYGRLLRRAGERTLVFCQVGRFIEFYGPQREVAAHVLRLVRVGIGRGGHAFSVGFPVSLRAAYLSRAVRAGCVVADVREVGRVEPQCAERRVVAIWVPAGKPNRAAAGAGHHGSGR